MDPRPRPTIKASVPVFGDGSMEAGIIQKLAPIFNNIAREIGMLNQRLARLEAIGPGVQITYTPPTTKELKEAIDIIAPKFDLEDTWSEENEKDAETTITTKGD